jgi:hypothetical protein
MRALVLCAAMLTSAVPASALDYYVRNGGSDANDGQSMATAWATLGHAADLVDAGDTVHVLDGSYQGCDLRRHTRGPRPRRCGRVRARGIQPAGRAAPALRRGRGVDALPLTRAGRAPFRGGRNRTRRVS